MEIALLETDIGWNDLILLFGLVATLMNMHLYENESWYDDSMKNLLRHEKCNLSFAHFKI
jgi:hypothetical protein